MYDVKSKFENNSPLPCWKGYKRKPGTAEFSKGSCVKVSSPTTKKQKEKVMAFKQLNNPFKKQKGGGTKKTCLPAAKIRSMSKSERDKLVRAKRKAAKSGKYRRSSKTNVKGARKKGATLRDWFQKEDWRQVNDPSKKCGEK